MTGSSSLNHYRNNIRRRVMTNDGVWGLPCHCSSTCGWLVLGLVSLVIVPIAAGQDLITRELSIVKAEVRDFDQFQILDSDGRRWGWDQVLQATVQPDRQAEFDRWLQETGQPLFRIRHRLQLGDVDALSDVVEPIFDSVNRRGSTESSARYDFLVSLGAMKSRLHQGQRLAAVRPFVRSCQIKTQFQIDSGLEWTEDLSTEEIQAGLSHRLLPIFFDQQAANRELLPAGNWDALGGGGLVYNTAIAICSGDSHGARRGIEKLAQDNVNQNWSQIFQTQLDFANGQVMAVEKFRQAEWKSGLTSLQMHVVDYLLAEAASTDPRERDLATLAFVRLAVSSQVQDQGLVAAAFYRAMQLVQQNGQEREVEAFKKELLDNYPKTYHGRLVAAAN